MEERLIRLEKNFGLNIALFRVKGAALRQPPFGKAMEIAIWTILGVLVVQMFIFWRELSGINRRLGRLEGLAEGHLRKH